jgi:hypothetical protein
VAPGRTKKQKRTPNSPGLEIEILGDSASLDREGKCVGYRLTTGGRNLLLDCGSPALGMLGSEAFRQISGVLVSHCHEDHVRWLAEFALFKRFYVPGPDRLKVYATEDVHVEIRKFLQVFLERSLSYDRDRVIEFPCDSFIEPHILGYSARFRIKKIAFSGNTAFALRVADSRGKAVSPTRAKVIISPETGRARMLFRESKNGRWVEPECYFAFGDPEFYEKRESVLKAGGCSIKAVKDHFWHGMLGSGFEISSRGNRTFFSCDTVYDPKLWKKLATDVRPSRLRPSGRNFNRSHIIEGNINDYIEQTWSAERLKAALALYEKRGTVFHDVNTRESVIHTEYDVLASSGIENLVLVHAPEYFVSREMLARPGQVFVIRNGKFTEKTGKKSRASKPDIHIRDRGKFFVGYKNPKGSHEIFRKNGLLKHRAARKGRKTRALMRVSLHEITDGDCAAPPKNKKKK